MSGHANEEIHWRHLLQPGESFVQTPFQPDEVVRQSQSMLRRR